jgi:Fe-S-cluster containining protein
VYVDLLEADLVQLPKRAQKHVRYPSTLDILAAAIDSRRIEYAALATKEVTVRSGPLKGCTTTVCALLSGTPAKRVECRIYEQRPRACREAVKPGDRTCIEIRRKALDS